MRLPVSVAGSGARRPLAAAGLAAVLAALPLAASAQSADALLDKLVEKGILTVDEANELRDQADQDFTKAYQVKSGMPDWVTNLRFHGDFRGRFDGIYGGDTAFVDRNRWRYRLRFGVAAVLLDDFEVGFRLGSGDLDNAARISSGSDPLSGNQSFQNNAAKKGIFIDTAYARWSPLRTPDWAGTLILGKMENPFMFSDLLFDSDYTPEGIAQQVAYTPGRGQTLRFTGGQFVLDELGGSGQDPYLLGGQARLESVWSPQWASALGGAFLGIVNPQVLTSGGVPDVNAGNARQVVLAADGQSFTLGAPVSDFQTVVVDASVTYTFDEAPLYTGAFPVRVFTDFLHNFGADTASTGFDVGVTFGKAGRRRTWEATYRWKYLEGDAWWEETVDSDTGAFYTGPFNPASVPGALRAAGTGHGTGTNLRGHWVRLAWSPYDSLVFNLTWINAELIEAYLPDTPSRINRILVDAIWKF